MALLCAGCGNGSALVVRSVYLLEGKVETCDKCGGVPLVSCPDVFFDKPYHDANIGDHKSSPGGEWITSKKHKADRLKALGLREAGDRKRGAR